MEKQNNKKENVVDVKKSKLMLFYDIIFGMELVFRVVISWTVWYLFIVLFKTGVLTQVLLGLCAIAYVTYPVMRSLKDKLIKSE